MGQNAWEEVHYQPADSEGGINYGWDFLEGSHCYPAGQEECGRVGELPVAEYNHDDGSCSITGGGVYRGEAASLDGIYFNSDYCSGKVWGLAQVDGTWQYAELLDTDLKVTGAGTDDAGNVYFTSCNCEFSRDYDPLADPQGAVWQVVAADMVPEGAETAGSAGDGDDTASDSTESDSAESDNADADDGQEAVEATEVEVGLREWAIDMPTELPAGPTTFVVTNIGDFDHNIAIEGQGIERVFDANLAPGETMEMTVDLVPGNYYVYCPIGTHAAQGMELTLVVN